MDDQDSYLNEEEVNQQLNNVGNKVNQFGQGMVNGVKSGINDYKSIKNNGLQSSKKDLDNNDKKTEIPDPKTNNNQVGVTNPVTGSNNNSLSDKDNNLNDKNKDSKTKEKDKEKKDVNEQSKKSSLKEKINEHNPLTKLKEKVDEHNPLKKLNKKIEEKLNPAKILLKKVKLYGGLLLLGIALIVILILALVGGTVMQTTLHNITEDFVCSSGRITSAENITAKNTFGWHLRETGEYEITKVKKTVYTDYETPEGIVSIPHEEEVEESSPIYEAVFNNGIDVVIETDLKIRAIQPGTITKVDNDYIEINHNLNKENSHNNKTYITRYYNYGTLYKDTKENELVVKETTLFLSSNNTIHFEILEDDKYVDPNSIFGYENANTVCGNKDLIKTTRGTLDNEDIKLLYDNRCFDNTEYLGISTAKDMMCNGYNSGIFSDELVNYDGFKARETAPTRTNSFYYEQDSNNYGKYLEGECAMYATCRAQEILSTMGVNKSFTTNVNGGKFCSEVSGYQTGMTPRQGSLVSWSGGEKGYGHVAVVERVNSDGSILVSEMYINLGFYGTSAWSMIRVSPNPSETRKYNCTANGSGCWQMRTIPANRINDAGWGSDYRLNCFIYLLGD